MEYPMTVRMAAINAWFTSKLNGKKPCSKANTDNTTMASCAKLTIAPNEYCHCPNRIKMYVKIAIRANTMAIADDFHNSLETEAEILRDSVISYSPILSLHLSNPSLNLSVTCAVAVSTANK